MRRAVLFLALALLGLTPALAGGPSDPFTVSGIQVNASAASSVEAQDIAINSGRQRAWTALIHRLLKQDDWAKAPVLDDEAVERLLASYLPQNVRRSTTRYSASMTYVFNADAVRRVLRQSNIAYADASAHPILIVPLNPRYDAHGGWTGAFLNSRYSHAAVPLHLPIPDRATTSVLDGVSFDAVQWSQIQPIAGRVSAGEAMLLLLVNDHGKMVVKLRHLGPGAPWTIPDVALSDAPGAPRLYADAAEAAATAVIDAWKAHAAIDFSKRSKLTAAIGVDTLADWGAMQQKIVSIPTVTDVTVVAMDIGMGRIAITYVGTAEQLKDSLSQAGYDLENGDDGWTLAPNPPPATTTGTP
ncbi:MAG TPA: DUF2066 domain-containing protein [Rhizomicrobium sp.]|jgi:hypothetical protein|nr:DUF2066 domain-containing protein [Rhizomicrobium sp.]